MTIEQEHGKGDHYFEANPTCLKCSEDYKVRVKVLELLETPLSPLELSMYYRRHLRYLEKEGAIRFDATQDRWIRLETAEDFMKRR
jgi:hypothetical protein